VLQLQTTIDRGERGRLVAPATVAPATVALGTGAPATVAPTTAAIGPVALGTLALSALVLGAGVLGVSTGCGVLETAAPDDDSPAGEVEWASPVAVADSLDAPVGLAQRHTELIWGASNGRVEKIGKDGSGRSALADAPGHVVDLAVADFDLYWLDGEGGRIWTAPIDAGEPRLLSITATPPLALAVDATTLYWLEQGRIMAMSRYGTTPTSLALLPYDAADLAIDEANLYWSSPGSGTIDTMPIYGGMPMPVATGQTEPGSLAVDEQQLYWATDSAVMALDLTEPDAEPFVVVGGIGRPAWLYLAGGYVYWSSQVDGTVARAPKLGGAAQVVASGQEEPGAVVVDSQAVFWVRAGAGAEDGMLLRAGTL
jgi:hypothetical protein